MPKRGIPLTDSADRVLSSWAYGSFGVFSGLYYPYNKWTNTANTTMTHQFDQTWFRPVVIHTDYLVSGIGIEVTTLQVAGLLRIGLYAADRTLANVPGVLVEDLGTVDASTGGGKDAAFAASRQFKAGDVWWLAIQSNDTTIGYRAVEENWVGRPLTSASGAYLMRDSGANYAGGLPDPASPTRLGKATPNLLLKAV